MDETTSMNMYNAYTRSIHMHAVSNNTETTISCIYSRDHFFKTRHNTKSELFGECLISDLFLWHLQQALWWEVVGEGVDYPRSTGHLMETQAEQQQNLYS